MLKISFVVCVFSMSFVAAQDNFFKEVGSDRGVLEANTSTSLVEESMGSSSILYSFASSGALLELGENGLFYFVLGGVFQNTYPINDQYMIEGVLQPMHNATLAQQFSKNKKRELRLYPNPVKNTLCFETNASREVPLRYTLHSLSGLKISDATTTQRLTRLPLYIEPGTYIFTLFYEDGKNKTVLFVKD
tara:strand:- start:29 stop:598 length:570 start_codon:yes stop_codon:yes gene_type:complete